LSPAAPDAECSADQTTDDETDTDHDIPGRHVELNPEGGKAKAPGRTMGTSEPLTDHGSRVHLPGFEMGDITDPGSALTKGGRAGGGLGPRYQQWRNTANGSGKGPS
jgi:hypothetical protein